MEADPAEQTYIIATSKPWHLTAFAQRRTEFPGFWTLVTTPEDLERNLEICHPRYVFFPHWSHIVPQHIVKSFECVCFHMTDVPYGRGGSPLQNLIVQGHADTKLTALRMDEVLDAGPVYAKLPLSLKGSASEVFERTAGLTLEMMMRIVIDNPVPVPQEGQEVRFSRRSPADSRIASSGTVEQLYDHVRMLDAPGYPHAFLEWGEWKIEFRNATLLNKGMLEASALITRNEGKDV